MKVILAFLIGATVALNLVSSVPVTPAIPVAPTAPVSDIDFFQNATVPVCSTIDSASTFKNGIIDPRFRWTRFLVHYDIAYGDQERQAINDAMWNLMQVIPCVEFGIYPPESNPSGDFIHIIKGSNNGCNSWVGRQGGRQDMNLQSPGCMSVGTIMHEMIHALGFHHEQTRSDRDDYVNVYWDNMQDGTQFNFEKLGDGWTAYGVRYNYRSIMHYDSMAFSKNGQPTMLAKNGEPIGSVGSLQDTDTQKLKLMYNC